MADIDLIRSLHFVSLDTHPANNSLVITYEILVSVLDKTTGRELTRRSKRDQLQINISAINNLSENELRHSDELASNIRSLSEQVLRKCPLLSTERPDITEEIQLHLLYLINRRRTQLISQNLLPARPQSSASYRLKSAQGDGRASSLGHQRGTLSARHRESVHNDVYRNLYARERMSESIRLEHLRDFISIFEFYLNESGEQLGAIDVSNDTNVDVLLEGLYGDDTEKFNSIARIRKALSQDEYLLKISSNRIFVCALLRTLRDTNLDSSRSSFVRESILYCLIRLTTFRNIYAKLFMVEDENSINLLGVVIELIKENVDVLKQSDDFDTVIDNYYQTNSLLITLMNILEVEKKNEELLIQSYLVPFLESTNKIFEMLAKYLARDLRQMSQTKGRLISILSLWLMVLLKLSVYKKFNSQLRLARHIKILDSFVAILNLLQLSRPGSGISNEHQNQQLTIVKDPLVLNDIYEQEINMLRLINNFLFDDRLKARLIKRGLPLKCVLRNIVVFLANRSRIATTLNPFNKSAVLIIPFKCLYGLSCSDLVKKELFKSKIIIKCIFEYLLSATTDLKTAIDLHQSSFDHRSTSASTLELSKQLDTTNVSQISIEANDASQYIVALWVNLSSNKLAAFYDSKEVELQDSLTEYIDLILKIILTSVNSKITRRNQVDDDMYLMIYLQTKLLRNLTQFISIEVVQPSWIQAISDIIEGLLFKGDTVLLVECLATLTNLIEKYGKKLALDREGYIDIEHSDAGKPKSLLIKLTEVNFDNLDAENDDLILVSVNHLGILAKYYEICQEIHMIYGKVIEACNFILEMRSNDTELVTSCLYTVNQLTNHRAFLEDTLQHLFTEDSGKSRTPADQTRKLIELLCTLVAESTNISEGKLAGSILNKYKQLEEQLSLDDSLVGKTRFVTYNSKWLNAIRSNQDEGSNNEESQFELNLVGSIVGLHDAKLVDEFPNDRADSSNEYIDSTRLTKSKSPNPLVRPKTGRFKEQKAPRSVQSSILGSDRNEDEDIEVDDDDDVSSTGDQPDLNVIDSNSMITHLSNRKEFRDEWLKR